MFQKTWAIVELDNGAILCGMVSEVEALGTTLGVVESPDEDGATVYFGGHCVRQITPTGEEYIRPLAHVYMRRAGVYVEECDEEDEVPF